MLQEKKQEAANRVPKLKTIGYAKNYLDVSIYRTSTNTVSLTLFFIKILFFVL
jgi:hypothetical protein